MVRYLIVHPAGQKREDMLLEDEHLTLSFVGDWAVFSDAGGICLAISAAQGASIQRVDDEEEPGDWSPALNKQDPGECANTPGAWPT
ncbi:MAG: hypothetical protein HOZ81_04595 [Streptomyces sp.]|nr:hypothetical protein [Streptomyces sp.]